MKKSILLFAFFSLLFLACGKQQEGPAGYEGYEDHPTWTDSNPDAFWDKQPGDTTLCF